MDHSLTRRAFLRETAAATAGLALASELHAQSPEPEFASRWHEAPDRVWLGADYWANPLQDWRVAGGRIECVEAAGDRQVHLLTRQLGATPAGDLKMSVVVGRTDGLGWKAGSPGSAGFRLGIQGTLPDYRSALVNGHGFEAGLTGDGKLFIGPREGAVEFGLDPSLEAVELRLTAASADGGYRVTLAAHDPATGKLLGETKHEQVMPSGLEGNLALVTNFGVPVAAGKRGGGAKGGANAGRFWFNHWQVSGSKVAVHDEQAFGPILFNHYSLSRGVLKMTAQMPPMGAKDAETVSLEVLREGKWLPVAEGKIHPQSRNALLRVEKWNDQAEVPYRLAYVLGETHYLHGTIRRDPVDAPILTVADVSCNIHHAFPNTAYVAKMTKLNPDLIAFVGDQFYESTGGYGIRRDSLEPAILDYLRKWYFHGWTWRELTRDRPSLALPDDHDVYQGNIWGEGGAPVGPTQESGGYEMPPEWVNVVHRTQTGHHPDAFDPTPCAQGISTYYGSMNYGGISFAVLADRQFKSGPEGKVPATGGRGDHVSDPHWIPKSSDVPGLKLLGDRQITFLKQWARDWHGAEMKAVISQTIFTAMATTHGDKRERLIADYDANGWPQTPRAAALREIRKVFALHIAGDQHLPAVVQYGVDEHRDGPVAFAGPAVNVGYPRWFEPAKPGENRKSGASENTGDFLDTFGNYMTVHAVANGAVKPRSTPLEHMQDKASGLGLVRFDKTRRTVTLECWPFLADPLQPGTQFPGWPVSFEMLENYGRKPAAHLPALKITGLERPVLEIIEEATGELVYALRLPSRTWQPHVFAPGKYTVRLSEPETGKAREWPGIEAKPEHSGTLELSV